MSGIRIVSLIGIASLSIKSPYLMVYIALRTENLQLSSFSCGAPQRRSKGYQYSIEPLTLHISRKQRPVVQREGVQADWERTFS